MPAFGGMRAILEDPTGARDLTITYPIETSNSEVLTLNTPQYWGNRTVAARCLPVPAPVLEILLVFP